MANNIVVNVQNREIRVGIVENSRLAEVYVERANQIVGSIYKCKVKNVLGGMDAAFVDIGMERNAFLYSGDILPHVSQLENTKKTQKKFTKTKSIHNLISEGQEFLVQVVKAPRAAKGARVSTKITLPGRYIVLVPQSDIIGISKRIVDEERNRLKTLMETLCPKGYGVIVRTEAEGKSEKDIKYDIDLMLKIWKDILEKAEDSKAPSTIYKELSLIYQTIRDSFTSEIAAMYIDSEIEYKKAQTLIELLAPKFKSKLKLYKDQTPIFEHFGLENDYQQLFKRKVWLESGGYICIDHAEALTVIDVNTGKFIGNKSLKDTVITTNLQAANEIARQIRLRDIGGIIVVDFIDMNNSTDQQRLLKAFQVAINKERTKTNISGVSALGLVELTRKRVSETISESTTEICPYCDGRSRIESAETVSLRAEREIRNFILKSQTSYGIYVSANPDTAYHLIGDRAANIDELEKIYKIPIYVRSKTEMHIEDFKVSAISLAGMDRISPVKLNQVYTVKPERSVLSDEDKAFVWIEGFLVEIPHGGKYIGKQIKIQIKEVFKSYASAKIKLL